MFLSSKLNTILLRQANTLDGRRLLKMNGLRSVRPQFSMMCEIGIQTV